MLNDAQGPYLKAMLKSIYPCKEDFRLRLTHKSPKTLSGCYSINLKRINIHDGLGGLEFCKKVAIHEYAHHIHYTECHEKGDKPHGRKFWMIHDALLAVATQKGIFVEERIENIVMS